MTSTVPSQDTPSTTGTDESSSTPSAKLVPTRRLTELPAYVFAWLDELKAEATAHGADLIDLGMGNPDQPTPAPIIQAITDAFGDSRNHGYPPFRGTEQFRKSAAAFMERRFGVAASAQTEILCLSGAKEGLAHAIMAFSDETTTCLVPDIYYPVHGRTSGLIGGRTHFLPLLAERGFLPDFGAVPANVLQDASILVLNYPHNPTGTVAPLDVFEEAVSFCRKHGMLLISDLAYSELTFDGSVAPSALQVPGAKDVTLEFHSFSKTFNMAGSRIGFAVGGPHLIDALYAVRTNLGYGTPSAIQAGAAFALDHALELQAPLVNRYRERAEAVVRGFRSLGWTVQPPRATMFVWLPVPAGYDSKQWTKHLVDTTGVVVSPGSAFGPGGDGFFRVSLIADVAVLDAAIERLRAAGIRFDQPG
jgi:LL-diaminopimelate aminotransferase